MLYLQKNKVMKIVHVAAECYPVVKTGGLGDVLGALPKYLNSIKGVEAVVVLPFVENDYVRNSTFEVDYRFVMPHGINQLQVEVLRNNSLAFSLYMVKIEGFTHRTKVYGYDDDDYFFTAFQIATLNWLHQWEEQPDVVHCHDYHTGFIPFLMSHAHQYPKFRDIPSIFTIHNAEHQGVMSWRVVDTFPWFDTWQLNLLEWNDKLNAMASAIKCAWRVTTVSSQYMQELIDAETALAPLFQAETSKCMGILNGIDNKEWNPEDDKFLEHHYNVKTVANGKEKNKKAFCKQFGFDETLPLVVFIGRFAAQKGVDVLADAIWRSINQSEQKISFFIMGSGDAELSRGLEEMNAATNHQFNCYVGYNEELARQVYAAADFLVMPSRFEPCGLNQFYALRYGTVPIVRTVGGLLNSIIDINDKNGNGIRFIQINSNDLLHSFWRAEELYHHKEQFKALREFIMCQDFSWEKAAQDYLQLYKTIML